MLTTILMAFNIHSSTSSHVSHTSCIGKLWVISARGGGGRLGERTPEYVSCMFYHVTDGQRHGRRKSL